MAFWFCREDGCNLGRQGGLHPMSFTQAVREATRHAERPDLRTPRGRHEVSVRGEREVFTRRPSGLWSPPILLREVGVDEVF